MQGEGLKRKKAFAVLEYVVLIIIVLALVFGFRSYIQRGLQGQYRKVSETFGFLRQYNPEATIECAYDDQLNVWYAQACYNNKVLPCKSSADYRSCVNGVKTGCQAGCRNQP
jgi:hypothetical protein